MAETKPIPVRLTGDVTSRLDKAAKRIGNNRAGIIRFLIDSWLENFEKKGMASLPPNWEEILAASDHRRKESRSVYPDLDRAGGFALAEVSSTKAVEAGLTALVDAAPGAVASGAGSPKRLLKVPRKARAARPPAAPKS